MEYFSAFYSRLIQLVFLLTCLLAYNQANADLFMSSSELIHEKGKIVEEHKRLAKKLTDISGANIKLTNPRNWPMYTKTILGEEYDLMFANASISAYSIPYENALDVYHLGSFPGYRTHHIVTYKDSDLKFIKDIKTKRLCARPPNKLSRVQAARAFTNPVLQPTIVEFKGQSQSTLQGLLDKRCVAAVISDKQLKKHQANPSKSPLKILKTLSKAPNPSILLSNRFTREQKEKIALYLYSPNFAKEFKLLFDYYSDSSEIRTLKPMDKVEHKPFNILAGVSWGW